METRAAAVSPIYLLERFEPCIVHLDKQRHVIGMNDFARRVLPVEASSTRCWWRWPTSR